MGHYIERDGVPVRCEDLIEWARAFETANRRVALDELPGYRVSTVFLGLDHSFGVGPPLLYETMVFPKDSALDEDCRRYSTREQALAGHAEVVAEWQARIAGTAFK